MKQLLGVIQKEFYHIFRDKRTLLILFGIPAVQIILFGYAISNEIKSAKIAVVDMAHDVYSEQITDKILSTDYFKLEEQTRTYDELNAAFKRGKIKAAVVFPPNFEADCKKEGIARVQIIADATDPNIGTSITGYLQGQIAEYLMAKEQARGGMPYPIDVRVEMLYNKELKSVFMFVPGLMTIILMLISTMLTAIAITREKETGTMEVLLASPISAATLIVGKVIPYLILSFVNALVILALGYFVFGVPVVGSFGLLMAECFLYVLVALCLGILISTKVETQQVALLVSLFALFMPTMLLSGFIFPIENMPWPLQMVSRIVPATYFNIIVKSIMLKGVGIAVLWKETVVLLVMLVVLLGASIKNFKIRLE